MQGVSSHQFLVVELILALCDVTTLVEPPLTPPGADHLLTLIQLLSIRMSYSPLADPVRHIILPGLPLPAEDQDQPGFGHRLLHVLRFRTIPITDHPLAACFCTGSVIRLWDHSGSLP